MRLAKLAGLGDRQMYWQSDFLVVEWSCFVFSILWLWRMPDECALYEEQKSNDRHCLFKLIFSGLDTFSVQTCKLWSIFSFRPVPTGLCFPKSHFWSMNSNIHQLIVIFPLLPPQRNLEGRRFVWFESGNFILRQCSWVDETEKSCFLSKGPYWHPRF